MHRLFVKIAWMEKLDQERQLAIRPQRTVAIETNFAVLVVIKFIRTKDAGQFRTWRLEGIARPFFGFLCYIIKIDICRLDPCERDLPVGANERPNHDSATQSQHMRL